MKLSFDINEDIAAPYIATGARPKVAVLREQGVNSHVEMAAAFHRAGFDAIDVHMSDLLGGRIGLGNFHALVACGGFSYGDVLGRAKAGRNPFCLTIGCATNSKPSSIVHRRWRLGCATVVR